MLFITMDDVKKDIENVLPHSQGETSSVSQQQASTQQQAEARKEKGEEKTIPYSRFREVNEKMKSLEAEINSLKSKKAEDGLTPEQQQELQAKQYLKNLLKETLDEERRAREEAERLEQERFEAEVNDVLYLHQDVSKDDFLKFIEEKSEVYGITSVAGAMKLYLDLRNIQKEVADKTKKSLASKPSLPQHEGGAGRGIPYDQTPEFKQKSLRQIAEEAIRELTKK